MTSDAPMTDPSRRDVTRAVARLPLAAGGVTLLSAARRFDPVAALLLPFAHAADDAALSAAVVHRGKAKYYNFGTLAKGSNVAASERSIYEIGSITKTFTGLILAHAIGEGELSLSDPVTRYLPAGFDNLTEGGRAVTFADLVTTTSAIPNNIPDWRVTLHDVAPREIPGRYAQMLENYTEADFLADLQKARLDGVPGEKARHSNAASQLLGIALERVYRQPYAALIARYIERPLGMRSGTGVVPPAQLVTGYDGVAMPPLTMPAIKPAGGLRYSAADMALYIRAQIAASDPAVALTQKPLWGPAGTQPIGFHWTIGKAPDGATYLRHGGGTFGFSSYCDLYPEQGYGVVLLVNRAGEIQGRLPQLADAIHERTV